MKNRFFTLLYAVSLLLTALCASAEKPWSMDALKKAPQAVFGSTTNRLVSPLYYAGELFEGKPTRIFAYYGRPEGKGPFPAMVLVHGGGGKAFEDWAEYWAKRGYVALAMDLGGCGPDGKRLPDGGPEQGDGSKFKDFSRSTVRDMWTYHAISAVLRGVSLLASRPEVDDDRIGITGISWGGYLTCIAAGLDHRLKAAVPVYGCGFLDQNSVWLPLFEKMNSEQRALWVDCFDPSRYLAGVRCPILFVNGTCDFAYPLDSYQKSYNLVKPALLHISVEINRPHGHIWTFPEVDAFIDNNLKHGKPLARTRKTRVKAGVLETKVTCPFPVRSMALNYTTNSGPWQKRTWVEQPVEVTRGVVKAALPDARPITAYLRIIDERGLSVSSPHIELP